jgi:4'-phosphopantetheinyl transferase
MDPVDVHWIDMDAPGGAIAGLGDLLDDAERARAARFRFDRDRRRYVVRHGRLRQLLGDYLGCAPARVILTWGRFGKPAVAGGGIHFSIATSRRLALYAIARDRAVGCDVEYRDPRFAADRIAERFFSPAEVRALRALDAARQTEGFFNCWTRKEAYLKARGDGLGVALDSFDVTLAPEAPAALLRGCDGWSVASFEPAPGYQAAVVAAGAACRIKRGASLGRLSGSWPRSGRRRSPASRDRSARLPGAWR